MPSTPTWGTFWRVRAVLLGCRTSSPEARSLWREPCWAARSCLPEGGRSRSRAVFGGARHQDKRRWAQTERREVLLGRRRGLCGDADRTVAQVAQEGRRVTQTHSEVFTRPADVAPGKWLWVACLSGAVRRAGADALQRCPPAPTTPCTVSRGAASLLAMRLPGLWLQRPWEQGFLEPCPGLAPPRWSSPGTVALPMAPGRRRPFNSVFPSLCLQWCWILEETS